VELGQKDAARDTFTKVLDLDRNNRTVSLSLGYLARDAGDSKLAENYFTRAAAHIPKTSVRTLPWGPIYGRAQLPRGRNQL